MVQQIPLKFSPRYNLAPTQDAPVVVNGGERQLKLMRWGLVPHWAKDLSIGVKMINARAETLAEKPSFRKPPGRAALPSNCGRIL